MYYSESTQKAVKVILIADDDLDDRELLEEAFLALDNTAQIHPVGSGKEVLEYLDACADHELPGLIVLDYNMPGLSGAEIIEQLCFTRRFRNIPAVVWSTSDSPVFREQAHQKGAKAYFRKPINYDGILHMAQKMLELYAVRFVP